MQKHATLRKWFRAAHALGAAGLLALAAALSVSLPARAGPAPTLPRADHATAISECVAEHVVRARAPAPQAMAHAIARFSAPPIRGATLNTDPDRRATQ